MHTPGWVRRHRTRNHQTTTQLRAELATQALERITNEDAQRAAEWTPRRGMSFATDR